MNFENQTKVAEREAKMEDLRDNNRVVWSVPETWNHLRPAPSNPKKNVQIST